MKRLTCALGMVLAATGLASAESPALEQRVAERIWRPQEFRELADALGCPHVKAESEAAGWRGLAEVRGNLLSCLVAQRMAREPALRRLLDGRP